MKLVDRNGRNHLRKEEGKESVKMTLVFLQRRFWLKLVYVSALVLFPEIINADVGTGSREKETT